MSNVAIVTDSAASIPNDVLNSLKITWVPYYIHFEKKVLRDLVDIGKADFYKWLKSTSTFPKTACPGPGDYISIYKHLACHQNTKEIISIHMTSKGSGAYQAALNAKNILAKEIPELKIAVIDSMNVSMCQGWIAIEAARAAVQNISFAKILKMIEELTPKVKMIQTADTLKYLAMGGRIGKAKHLLASILNIKPLIGMVNGEITALGKTLSINSAYEMMCQRIAKDVGENGKIKAAFVHADAKDQIAVLAELITERFNCVETIVTELAPSLGVHSGPGTTGLCYYVL